MLRQGYIARGGQIIDASLIPAPKQHFSRDDKEQSKERAMPADWRPAKPRRKDLDATWAKKHGKSPHGYKLSINVDKRYEAPDLPQGGGCCCLMTPEMGRLAKNMGKSEKKRGEAA